MIYHEAYDAEKLADYLALSGPAVAAAGGKILVRGGKIKAMEEGGNQRTVMVEFNSFDAALAAYESDAYKAARAKIDGAVVRDFRILQGGGVA